VLHNKVHFFLGVMLAVLLGLSSYSFAASQKEELRLLEKEVETRRKNSSELQNKSKSLQQEAVALRAELISLSQSVQQREANVTRLEIAIADLIIEEKQARFSLEERHGQSVDTLIALQRLALNPPEAIIAMPQAPGDMVRSAILLRSIVPEIQKQAAALQLEVNAYAKQRKLLESQKARLGTANQNLGDERRRLTALIADKKAMSKRFIRDSKAETKRVAKLTSKAKSLRGLLDKIKKDQRIQAKKKKIEKAKPSSSDLNEREIVLGKPPSGKPMGKSKGKLSRPSSGQLVMKYGQKEKLGGKHKGISFKTRRGAQIIATYDGKIAFAGPFRGYKQLLIIDHGDVYHTLLTGMERIDVSVGQWLLSGEPVGVMSSNRSSDATLYFELRRNGAPINPLPWIRQRNAKAQG